MLTQKWEFSFESPPCLFVLTCLSFCHNRLGGFVVFEGPDVYCVEDARRQTGQPVRGAVRSDWYFLVWALRGAVGEDVAINVRTDWIPWHAEAGLCFVLG